MGQLVKNDNLKATGRVLDELERKDDSALKWSKDHDLFIPVDEEIQEIVRTIMGKYPRIVAEGGQKNMADPFVVAFAKQHNLTVITAENKSGSEKKPTIPFLCKEFGVNYISILELIRKEKWSWS